MIKVSFYAEEIKFLKKIKIVVTFMKYLRLIKKMRITINTYYVKHSTIKNTQL